MFAISNNETIDIAMLSPPD